MKPHFALRFNVSYSSIVMIKPYFWFYQYKPKCLFTMNLFIYDWKGTQARVYKGYKPQFSLTYYFSNQNMFIKSGVQALLVQFMYLILVTYSKSTVQTCDDVYKYYQFIDYQVNDCISDPSTKSLFWRIDTKLSWSNARDACRASINGDLAVPKTTF